ncbi:MAG: dipeptidase [Phycisphaerales bacterium]|nr:dipeptidase [Phycisphaerales bacterium]
MAIDVGRLARVDPGIGEIRGGMGVSEVTPPSIERRIAPLLRDDRLHIGILMENADPIRSPDEMAWWQERGVVAVGLTWGRSSRYATGNAVDDDNREGLSDLGREMVRVMDDLGVVHDLSHLSQAATEELLTLTDARVMASHTNCRALLGGVNQRHLTDEAIIEIARRGGIIGLNLARNFIRHTLEGRERPSVDEAIRHVERVCFLTGHKRAVGLGSDMDGGFSALDMCEGIECPADLVRLAEALSQRGWSDEEVKGFMWGNWMRFWAESGS